MQESQLLNKKFNFKMPLLTKSNDFKEAERDEFGCKHIEFGLSTTVKDLQGDTMTDNALNKMVELLKETPIAINNGHNHSIRDEIGPTTDVWIDGTDLIVDLRVRTMWEDEIEDVLNSGLPLGGSIEGVAVATKTITQKSMDDGFILKKEIIDDLQLFAGALTTIPAAWNLRGSAKSKTCTHSMCAQIQKSLDMKNLGVVKIKKSDYKLDKATGDDTISVINTDGSFESLRADIDEALSAKYTDSEGSGMRGCYIRYTFPDEVIVEPWVGDDIYIIPFSRDVNTDEITLGDPRPGEVQIVTKMIQEFEATNDLKKSMKTFNDKGGDKLTKEKDEGFVKKLKGLFDSGHLDFMKSNDSEPGEEPPVTNEPEPTAPGGEPMEKDMISKADLTKMLDERDTKFEKTLKAKDEKIKSLEERLDNSDEVTVKKTKKELLNKSLELHKKLEPDMTPEEESELVKEIKADLEKDIGPELVKRDIKTMTKSLEGRAAHELPFTGGHKQKGLGDKYNDEIKEVQKSLDDQGKVGV